MEETRFLGLPPLKRFRLQQQQQQQTDSSCLPAKKRKECRDSPSPPAATTLCLPAKKRIWAFQPLDLDLNLNPPSDEDSAQIKLNFGEDGEDGIVCAVCDSTDGDPADPIVLCDGCDLMVHATCYGHPFTAGIPDGDWYCAQCLHSKSEKNQPPSCCLCPVGGGALKPTTDGRWAHLVCAIYVPEVFFADSEGREGINCDRVGKRRWETECYICKSKNGCAIDCSEPKCGSAFHVSCGLKEELCIEYREGKGKSRGSVVAAFCSPHTHLWKKQEQTGKFKIVARGDDNK